MLRPGVRDKLLQSDDFVCPGCGVNDVSPNDLKPNVELRNKVVNYKANGTLTSTLKPSLPARVSSPAGYVFISSRVCREEAIAMIIVHALPCRPAAKLSPPAVHVVNCGSTTTFESLDFT